MTADGNGGGLITWEDARDTTFNPNRGTDIYCQWINNQGSTLWTANGVAVCTADNRQRDSIIIPDSAGGAFVSWGDFRSTTNNINAGIDIYFQHLNNSGTPLWTANGFAICTLNYNQQREQIVTDHSNGFIITWSDNRNSTDYDIYVQHVNGNSSTLWVSDGIDISTVPYNQQLPQMISDGFGGAIITWEDYRSNGTSSDIYAQRIYSDGSVTLPVAIPRTTWDLFDK